MSDKKSGAVILRVYNAQLPVLPAPLKLRQSILAVVEEWSDKTYAACLPIASLVGEGDTEADALFALGEEILEFAQTGDESDRGWVALSALVVIPAPEAFGAPPPPEEEPKIPALDLAKLAPFRVLLDDSGDEFTGWPSIEARPEADLTLVHRAGFKQQFWGDLSQRQAVELAEEIVRLLNAAHGKSDGLVVPIAIGGQLRDLAQGLRQRAKACADMAEDDRYEKDVGRLKGKASAYGHAAEMLENLLKEGGA